jgi:hypothetical protein
VCSVTCEYDVGLEWEPGVVSLAASGLLAAQRLELDSARFRGQPSITTVRRSDLTPL